MTRCTLISALVAVLLLPALSFAESATEEVSADLGWEQFDDPSFDPAQALADEAVVASEETTDLPTDSEILGSVAAESSLRKTSGPQIQLEPSMGAAAIQPTGIVLGPRGVDDLGRAGRLHTVAGGDTLWDLSAAYLGTPWVWPSVWIDNDDIDNPHLILPGNKIWITANEMRVVTDAEAESFLAPVADADSSASTEDPLAMDDSMMDEDDSMPVAALDDAMETMDEPSTLDAFPVAIPGAPTQASMSGRRVTVVRREQMGFVSAERFAAASSIVGSPTERFYLSQGDDVILGLGEGDVSVGDQFTIFTVIEEVRDPETLRLLGHHVDPLGWAEIKELTGDTSIAQIRTSYAEIDRGALIVPREPVERTVEVRITPDAIEGEIVFLPALRTIMADGGYVYLNRGEFHGVEIGSELEVFDGGSIERESERRVDVRTPDQIVARLVVVSVEPDSAVGFVLWSNRELAVGDSIRPTIPKLARR